MVIIHCQLAIFGITISSTSGYLSRILAVLGASMPIPAWDPILNSLPPHTGSPVNIQDLSPFKCSLIELCQRFDGSDERKTILSGLVNLRRELMDSGLQGFQWISGSFIDNIEALESRSPKDVDVVTFVDSPASSIDIGNAINSHDPNLFDHGHIKSTFCVDHYLIPLDISPRDIVNNVRYWYGLFSHRRDSIWKGMLYCELALPADDSAARAHMGLPL